MGGLRLPRPNSSSSGVPGPGPHSHGLHGHGQGGHGPGGYGIGRLGGPRIAVPGAVALALVVVFLIAWATRPGAARVAAHGAQSVAVTSVTRSCPPAAPGADGARVAMIALPRQATSGGAGTPAGAATLSTVRAAGTGSGRGSGSGATKPAQPVTVSAPGTVATVAPAAGGAAAVAATGRMAEGFEAEQTDASGTGLVSCTHASSDMWFVGTGESAGAAQIWLYLVNTGTVTASVDVTILTDSGEQSGLSSAITVAPDQLVPENIAPLVRGSQALAVQVQTNTGQVAASVWEGDGQGSGAWLPQAAAPATTVVIPGLTVASSTARLFVAVPGDGNAQLKVVAYTPAGMAPQFTATPVDASAGAATALPLNALGASAAGLKLTSNVPIVAGVLVPGSGVGSFTAGTMPVAEQGVVAANPATPGVTVGLLLTAPSAVAHVSISVISADGTVTVPAGDQSVTVSAAHTLAVTVPRPSRSGGRPFAVVIRPQPGSGPLYAARAVTSGSGGLSAPLSSLLPVSSARTSIDLPAAQNAYTAVIP
ncbi:MAG TPA: DUF5719 family protein [Trebonia sp.]|nr:DUF5719 family protein [Trebonia sp.]